jgi:hypothetical protein
VEAGENGASISADGALFFGRRISGTFTERARIDSSGNLLVGTTSASAKMVIEQAANLRGILVGASSNDASDRFFSGYSSSASADTFRVYTNGNVVNTNNSYGSISDNKLKENVTDATPKLEKLQQVRVVNYNLIGSEHKQLGVIAQELEQIFPGMVEETPDRDQEGNDLGTTTKSVKYSVFVPMLIKALQEQTEIIASLTARVAALESN